MNQLEAREVGWKGGRGEREVSTDDADIRVMKKCGVVGLLDWIG